MPAVCSIFCWGLIPVVGRAVTSLSRRALFRCVHLPESLPGSGLLGCSHVLLFMGQCCEHRASLLVLLFREGHLWPGRQGRRLCPHVEDGGVVLRGTHPSHEDSAFDPHRRPWESSCDARRPWGGATPKGTWGRRRGAVGKRLD